MPTPPTTRLQVHVQPGARTEGIARWEGDVPYLRVTAPPADGRANQAVERLLARLLGLPPSAVRVDRGATGRQKLVAIQGLELVEVMRRLRAGAG